MLTSFVKKLTIFAIPALILAAAELYLPRAAGLSAARHELMLEAPYIAIFLGILLSAHFHRGRAFCVLLMLGLAYWGLRLRFEGGLAGAKGEIVIQSLSFLLPTNIMLFSFMRERGVVSVAGRMRLGFILLQAGAVAWIVRFDNQYAAIPRLLSAKLSESPFLAHFPLPQSSVPVFALSLAAAGGRTLFRQSPLESAFVGAMLAGWIAMARGGSENAPPLFMTAAAVTLAFAILYDFYLMAYRDELTGLPSRRALSERLAGGGRHFVAAMVDVDHFKGFNDTYGHDVGDQVLKMVAARMRDVTGGGRAYRYGGEEFTIIFPGAELKETLPHLEKLRQIIAEYEMRLRGEDRPSKEESGKRLRGASKGGKTVSVTVSIGAAQSNAGHRTPDDVLRAADKALYKAKNRGRNQVCTGS